jgi:hypothetical protein
MNLLEKVARAMCKADGKIWEYTIDEPDKNDSVHDSLRDMYVAHALASLKVTGKPIWIDGEVDE